MAIYLNEWKNKDDENGVATIKYQFNIKEEALKDVEIQLASYTYHSDYTGRAYVLFKKDGKFYEVNASHDSLYGLENKWNPQKINILKVYHQSKSRNYRSGDYAYELSELLEHLPELKLLKLVNKEIDN